MEIFDKQNFFGKYNRKIGLYTYEKLGNQAFMLKNLSSYLARLLLQTKIRITISSPLSSITLKKLSHLKSLQRFWDQKANHDYPPPLNTTTPIPLTLNDVLPNPRKRNLSALTNFSGDGDDGAEKSDESDNSLQQITSKIK